MKRSKGKSPFFSCYYSRAVKKADCNAVKVYENELELLLFDIISKQAQVIMGVVSLGNMADLSLHTVEQAEYEKRIALCHDEKRTLYEQYVIGEVDAEAYKTKKAAIETELAGLNRACNALKTETAGISAKKISDDELRNLAESAITTGKLSRQLVDLLIEKVYIFPSDRVEIVWKVTEFADIRK